MALNTRMLVVAMALACLPASGAIGLIESPLTISLKPLTTAAAWRAALGIAGSGSGLTNVHTATQFLITDGTNVFLKSGVQVTNLVDYGKVTVTNAVNGGYTTIESNSIFVSGGVAGSLTLYDDAATKWVRQQAPSTVTSNLNVIWPAYPSNGVLTATASSLTNITLTYGGAGGSQTPITGDINFAGFQLTNAGNIISTGLVNGNFILTNTHSRFLNIYEEYTAGVVTVWNLPTSFGGSVFANGIAGDQQHLGIAIINSAAGTTNGFYNGALTQLMLGGGPTIYETVLKIATLGTGATLYTLDFGCGGAIEYGQNWDNGVWFRYGSDLNSGNWIVMSSNGGTVSSNNTTTAATTAWTKFTWSVPAAGSPVIYYIGGSPVFTNSTANVPTNNVYGLIYRLTERSASGTTRQVFIDYTDYTCHFTTPR